jgi:deoxyribonuclease V
VGLARNLTTARTQITQTGPGYRAGHRGAVAVGRSRVCDRGRALPGFWGGARAAAVVAADGRFSEIVAERTEDMAEVLPYRPGEFYLRELPPIRTVLSGHCGLGLLVVDGYADLDPGSRPGLGAHAHAEFGIPVIGVAKTATATATHAVPILRGTSARPLFVTAAGMPRDEAADLVRRMAGQHRLPDAIRRADTLARTSLPAAELPHRQHG